MTSKFDEPAITGAFRRGCVYVGAIGSKKTLGGAAPPPGPGRRESVGRRCGSACMGRSDWISAVRAPGETALAILAEVVATRYQATGTPLSVKAGAKLSSGAGGQATG